MAVGGWYLASSEGKQVPKRHSNCNDSERPAKRPKGTRRIANGAAPWCVSPLLDSNQPKILLDSSQSQPDHCLPGPPSPLTPMTLANAAYLGIERFASDRNKENWSNAT